MKLTEAQLPFRDRPFQLLSIQSWIQMALGVLALVVIFALVRPLWDRLAGIVPGMQAMAAPWPLAQAGAATERVEVAADPVTPVVRILQ